MNTLLLNKICCDSVRFMVTDRIEGLIYHLSMYSTVSCIICRCLKILVDRVQVDLYSIFVSTSDITTVQYILLKLWGRLICRLCFSIGSA